MNANLPLFSYAFSVSEVEAFSTYSGDRNPMHLEPVYARRTQAGAPVVHGALLVLWSLNELAKAEPGLSIRAMSVRLSKFVYPGERVDLVLRRTEGKIRLDICVEHEPRSTVNLTIGEPSIDEMSQAESDRPHVPFEAPIQVLDLDEVEGLAGDLSLGESVAFAAQQFPEAARVIGPGRVASIAATSRLVGMVCPGLHSIFSEMSFKFVESDVPEDVLRFHVSLLDRRFRLSEMAVFGPNLMGSVRAFVRIPPVSQRPMNDLRGAISENEFAGSTALIVGGSRGLGELTAKIVASGGGRVILTWVNGRDDAEAVAKDINDNGGYATVIRYDARQDATNQLSDLADKVTHAYYFPTPAIFKGQSGFFSKERFAEFLEVYVDGFLGLATALRVRNSEVSLFYPSSIALEERPKGMTEYSMAKAAGEVMCADMNESLVPIHVTVHRLPRLLTDQTATVQSVWTPDPVDVMLPIIQEVQSWPRGD